MSSDKVVDYLTKQLSVEKNIVTFRSLSRALAIHVNEAKNELARYHSAGDTGAGSAFATYLVSGEPKASSLRRSASADEMDIDEEEANESDSVIETKITLVSESDLDDAKAQYRRIYSVHVYSLSPSPIREPALVCEPTKALREAENAQLELPLVVGRITGPHVKLLPKTKGKARAVAASSSKAKLPGLQKPVPPAKDSKLPSKSEATIESKPEPKPEKLTAKPSGKLDFGKAPELKKTETKPKISVAKEETAGPSTSKARPLAGEKTIKVEMKRGVKRKTAIDMSDEEDETPPPAAPVKPAKPPSKTEVKSKNTARVKNGVVQSSGEEEEQSKPTRTKSTSKVKAPPIDVDATDDLKALMDIDDDQVTKISRRPAQPHKEEKDADTDIEMGDANASEPELAPAPPKAKPKRKPKKEVPIGSNGLKKKRVMKSHSTMDDKGYFVTVDYSSYESADEEEPEEPVKAKGKKASAKKADDDTPKPAPKLQQKSSFVGNATKQKKAVSLAKAASKGGTINNYFTKK